LATFGRFQPPDFPISASAYHELRDQVVQWCASQLIEGA
jgi:hypothetical protein